MLSFGNIGKGYCWPSQDWINPLEQSRRAKFNIEVNGRPYNIMEMILECFGKFWKTWSSLSENKVHKPRQYICLKQLLGFKRRFWELQKDLEVKQNIFRKIIPRPTWWWNNIFHKTLAHMIGRQFFLGTSGVPDQNSNILGIIWSNQDIRPTSLDSKIHFHSGSYKFSPRNSTGSSSYLHSKLPSQRQFRT